MNSLTKQWYNKIIQILHLSGGFKLWERLVWNTISCMFYTLVEYIPYQLMMLIHSQYTVSPSGVANCRFFHGFPHASASILTNWRAFSDAGGRRPFEGQGFKINNSNDLWGNAIPAVLTTGDLLSKIERSQMFLLCSHLDHSQCEPQKKMLQKMLAKLYPTYFHRPFGKS